MTPFDPWALLAMLQAFYPAVSATALQRARRERPEYFAGGAIIGSKGDKLQLPDGRVWDLIFASGGPLSGQRWQVLDVTNDPGGAPDPFPLEPGPLDVLDEAIVLGPPLGSALEALVANGLSGLAGSDERLAAAGQTVVDADGAAEIARSYDEFMEPAIGAHVGIRAALDMDDLGDVIDATNRHDGEIDGGTRDYDEPLPPDDAEPDPGDPPRDDTDREKEPQER